MNEEPENPGMFESWQRFVAVTICMLLLSFILMALIAGLVWWARVLFDMVSTVGLDSSFGSSLPES